MSRVCESIQKVLEFGQRSFEEIAASREPEDLVGGYVRMRGMIGYFLEQEIYVRTLTDPESGEELELDPFLTGSGLCHLDRLKIGKFGSRNAYRFVSVPVNAIDTSADPFCDSCEDVFRDCVVKFYDFTYELAPSEDFENVDFCGKFFSKDPVSNSEGGAPNRHELKVNEMLEIACIVQLEEERGGDVESFGTRFGVKENACLVFGDENKAEPSERKVSLHVISYRRIPNYSPVRFIEIGYDGYRGESLSPTSVCAILGSLVSKRFPGLGDASDLYNAAVRHISRSVCEDDLVLAEYILLCVCNRRRLQSGSESAADSQFAVSPLTLHISGCDAEFSRRLRALLTANVSRVKWIDCDISALNSSLMTPHFDEDKDSFVTGHLQFPLVKNLVVVDETTLSEGKLTEKGIESVSNIASLVNSGRVNYGFPAYQIPIETESNNIVLSEGKNSVICNGTRVSIRYRDPGRADNGGGCKPATLGERREDKELPSHLGLYISIVSSCEEMIGFDQSTREHIADRFVEIRQKLSSSERQIHPSIIHDWVMLSRTQALLNGEQRLTSLRFDKFIQLEKARLCVL